jgi:hypothetical protein
VKKVAKPAGTHAGAEDEQLLDALVAQRAHAGRGRARAHDDPMSAIRVELSGARLELHVDREIVIHCGASSLMLSPDGRVTIRGTHLLSRATASNRIKGGTVQIN